MTELIKAKEVLKDFLNEHKKIHIQYHVDNDQYIEGLTDAVRILEKCISKDIERMAQYYEDQN